MYGLAVARRGVEAEAWTSPRSSTMRKPTVRTDGTPAGPPIAAVTTSLSFSLAGSLKLLAVTLKGMSVGHERAAPARS